MRSETVRGGETMKNNWLIYGSYLGILGIIVIAMSVFGLSTKIGLWIALLTAVGYAIVWPRW